MQDFLFLQSTSRDHIPLLDTEPAEHASSAISLFPSLLTSRSASSVSAGDDNDEDSSHMALTETLLARSHQADLDFQMELADEQSDNDDSGADEPTFDTYTTRSSATARDSATKRAFPPSSSTTSTASSSSTSLVAPSSSLPRSLRLSKSVDYLEMNTVTLD